jgi:hypothetical protein
MAAIGSSSEYLVPPDYYHGSYPPPPQGEALAARVTEFERRAQEQVNKEIGEPPLYYALAAVWLRIGEMVGVSPVTLPFWVRALNAVSAALLVWLGHVTAKAVFPDSALQRIGVPLLLAVFPQDTFYSIAPDAWSPLLLGAGYLGALRFGAATKGEGRAAAGTGLALAGSVLVKAANLPLAGVTGAGLLWRAGSLAKERGRGGVTRPLALAVACAAVPVAAWLVWNKLHHGDWTATAAKVARLTWTSKSLADWWPHPLFTPAGLYAFWSELAASFWRGELVWHAQRLTLPAMDVFYWSSSLLLPIVALWRLPERRSAREALWLAAACFASGVLFQLVLSLAFDFGSCFYPSRKDPIFTSGRLVTGALIPFLLLYVHGLDRALAFARSDRLRWLALGAIAAAVTLSELWLDLDVAPSAYNLFHLGG